MTEPRHRKPAAFRIEPEERVPPAPKQQPQPGKRQPRAVKGPGKVAVVPSEDDPFALPDPVTAPPPAATPTARRRSFPARLFFGATGLLVTLAAGLWVDNLVRSLFARSDWLGWAAFGLALLAGLSLVAILVREIAALSRLASVTRIRSRAQNVLDTDDTGEARAVIGDLVALFSGDPRTANGRERLEILAEDIIDGRDRLRLAEAELLGPLDARARKLILDAAKRVSVVTAVSPRALVDVGYVLFEAGRLIRRLSELYGGRPGTAGFLRLSRRVAGHLAVTGSIAVGDSLVQQVIGHGLAARLSSRLGEGVVNGLMTARIGVAAMEVVRPMPFSSLKRPRIGDFLADLARFSGRTGDNAEKKSGAEP